MIARLLSILSVICLVLAIGCSSKKKTDEDGGSGEGDDIVASDIRFDPRGSDSGTISGLVTINFEYDSSQLTAEAKQILAANAEWINNNPNVTMTIEGHCDSRGSNEYNLTLGERRAQTVRTYLQGLGVDSARLATTSFGEEQLNSMGDSESDHGKNRRANFVPR